MVRDETGELEKVDGNSRLAIVQHFADGSDRGSGGLRRGKVRKCHGHTCKASPAERDLDLAANM